MTSHLKKNLGRESSLYDKYIVNYVFVFHLDFQIQRNKKFGVFNQKLKCSDLKHIMPFVVFNFERQIRF